MSATGNGKEDAPRPDVRGENRSRVETTGEAYGLQWAVVTQAMGHRCGYVRVPDDSILFGCNYDDRADGTKIDPDARWDWDHPNHVEYEDTIAGRVECHGGLTYANDRPSDGLDDGWWFGFDCAHSGDKPDPALMSDEHKAIRAKYHDWDEPYATVKSAAYVEKECRALAACLALMLAQATPDPGGVSIPKEAGS